MKKIVKFFAGIMLLSSVVAFTGCKDNGSDAPKQKDNFAGTRWIPEPQVNALTNFVEEGSATRVKEVFERNYIDFALTGKTFTMGKSKGTYKVLSDDIAKLTINGSTDNFIIDSEDLTKATYKGQIYTKGSNPEYEDFSMVVEDFFYVSAGEKGYFIEGQVGSGIVRTGDNIQLVGYDKVINAKVQGIEMFQKVLDEAERGDNIGICLGKEIEEEDLAKGMVACKPGSLRNYSVFTADLHLLTQDEGGRHSPISSGYRPQIYLNKADVTCVITFNQENILPGDDATVTITLVDKMAIKENQEFTIREGSKKVGTGVIKAIIE